LPATTFEPIQATGGDVSDVTVDGVTYRVHSFKTTGSTNFVVSSVGNGDGVVEYLIAAGGGSGGGAFNNFASGGGGGGGGVLADNYTVSATTYAAVVGAGGAAVSGQLPGNPGGNSSVFGQTAVGGGRGGCWQTTGTLTNAGSGGSGGGGANASGGAQGAAGTAGQGNAGGDGLTYTANINSGGGGGGGAVSAGQNSTAAAGGNGGNGITSSITGTSLVYGSGGGGGHGNLGGSGGVRAGGGGGGNVGATAAIANSGGGGGGAGNANGGNYSSSAGSGGIVIIRYPINPTAIQIQTPSYIASPGAPVQMLYSRSDELSQWSAPVGLVATQILPLGLTITPRRANSLIVMQWMINGEVHYDTVWEIYLNGQLIRTPGYQGTNNAPSSPGRWSGYVAGIYDTAGDVNSTMENTFIQYSIVANSTSTMTFYPAIRASGATAYTFSLNRCAGSIGDSYETGISTGVIQEIAT
jgi:hypothetical protein